MGCAAKLQRKVRVNRLFQVPGTGLTNSARKGSASTRLAALFSQGRNISHKMSQHFLVRAVVEQLITTQVLSFPAEAVQCELDQSKWMFRMSLGGDGPPSSSTWSRPG